MIEAPSYLNISGSSPVNPIAVSLITTLSFSSGAAGNIDIKTSNLSLLEGGRLSSVTFNKGTGGKVSIKADDVKVIGLEPQANQDSSTIRSGSLGPGDAGSLVIDTSRLTVAKGGKINTATGTAGKGGKLTINAREFIEVIGSPEKNLASEITAEARIGNPRILKILNLPPDFSGDAGSININTPRLSLTNGGKISVRNEGTGDAGELKISANYIILKDNSLISAETKGGEGGNIFLSGDLLFLKDSSITGSTIKKGQGGNVNINADVVVALGKSSITATAEDARGGNIYITAKAVFFSPDFVISASSKAPQLEGTVTVITEETGAEDAATPAPDVISVPKVISACNPSSGPSKFVVLGTGGLREDPQSQASNTLRWQAKPSNVTSKPPNTELSTKQLLVEATGWQTLENGSVELIAKPQNLSSQAAAKPANCDQLSQKSQSQAYSFTHIE